MFGDAAAQAFHSLDECVAYFTIPRPMKDGEEYVASMYVATGGRFVMTRRHNPRQIQVYLNGNAITDRLKTVQRGDVQAEKEAFAEVFRGAGWQVDSILDQLEAAADIYCEPQGVVKLDAWSQGRVVLVGDAAYCPSAEAGMGTISSMVGAYVLAGEIGRHCGRADESDTDTRDTLIAALKSYEDTFRPFMDQVQKGIGEPNFLDKIPWTPLTVAMLSWFMWLVCLLKLNLIGSWILHEKVKGWKLPIYQEMLEG